jgi:hypothetical protein
VIAAGLREKVLASGLIELFLDYAASGAFNVHREIPEAEIEITTTVLGKGGQATVYLGRYQGKQVAVKAIDPEHIAFSWKVNSVHFFLFELKSLFFSLI